MTTASKVKSATIAQQRTFGIVKPTVTIHVTKQKLRGVGVVRLKHYQDDLDKYEADFVMVDDIPVVLQRYASNAKDEYTVLIDSAKALEKGKDPWAVSDAFLTALHLSQEQVVWENNELRSLLRKQAKGKPVAGKTARATAVVVGKAKNTTASPGAKPAVRAQSSAKKGVTATATKAASTRVAPRKEAAAKKSASVRLANKSGTLAVGSKARRG